MLTERSGFVSCGFVYVYVLYTYGPQKVFQWCWCYHVAPSSFDLPALGAAQEQQAYHETLISASETIPVENWMDT